MVKLSVNVNKIATVRNSRGGRVPSVLEAVRTCVAAGAPGITIHPRADARHITAADVREIARELAPLAGHYPALRLGPSWWFHDSQEGMLRFREQTTETAGFYNTVGFNDDTRAFLSIPARHDVARRMDCGFLAQLVAEHRLEEDEAHEVARALAYDLVKQAYRL